MHDISHHLEWQKKSFVLWQGHSGLWPVFGIFWPSEALRPYSVQKIPKTGLRPKWPCQSTKLFCHSKWWEMSCIDPWITFFYPQQVFPLQKVNFPVRKIPLEYTSSVRQQESSSTSKIYYAETAGPRKEFGADLNSSPYALQDCFYQHFI